MGTPFNLGPSVNSEYDEYSPAPTPDGKRLFFATNRKAEAHEQKEAWRATIRLTASMDFDLWMADLDEQAASVAPAPGTRDAPDDRAVTGFRGRRRLRQSGILRIPDHRSVLPSRIR